MRTIFSGVQPTGDLHIGNYYGAIKNFTLTSTHSGTERFFCVADLHTMTLKHTPSVLRDTSFEIAAAYVAADVNDNQTSIFVQSSVPSHTEMAWFLNCVARMGWLERMVQYKDKGGDDKERASVGLFSYPVLMAADILAYGTTLVPVGDDQDQHIGLARDIAQKMNKDFGTKLILPNAMKSSAPRIMSLIDPNRKMSKSDPNANSRINLTDDADTIAKKIRKATADTMPFPTDLTGDLPAAVRNLVTIYKAATGDHDRTIVNEFGGKGYGVFKPALAEALIEEIVPIGNSIKRMMKSDRAYLTSILTDGRDKAIAKTEPVMDEVRNALGLVRL